MKRVVSGLHNFLRYLAGNAKVKFAVGSPATDGKTVWLPALPDSLTEEDDILYRGHAVHEVGHVRYSDIDLFQRYAAVKGNTAKFILNAVEDAWMERAIARDHRAAEQWFRQKPALLRAKGKMRDGSANPAEALGCTVLFYLNRERGEGFEQALADALPNFRKFYGEHADGLLEKLYALLDAEFPSVKSTKAAALLADAILKIFEDAAEQEQQQEQQQDQQDQESGQGESSEQDQSDQGESSDGDGSDQGESADDSEDAEGEGESSDSEAGDESDGSGTSSLKQLWEELKNSDVDGEVLDTDEVVTQICREAEDGEGDYAEQQQQAFACAIDADPFSGTVPVVGDADLAQQLNASTAQDVRKLGNQLRDALRGMTRTTSRVTTNGQRVASQHLARIATGDMAVFQRKQSLPHASAAVSVAVDLSGSTYGPLSVKLHQAVMTLESALEQSGKGIVREILGFGAMVNNEPVFDRIVIAREWSEGHKRAMCRIGGMLKLVGGSTPTAEAIDFACRRLVARKESRKVLFVVTDGRPDNAETASQNAQRALAAGINVVVLVVGEASHTTWLQDGGIPFLHSESAEGITQLLIESAKEILS